MSNLSNLIFMKIIHLLKRILYKNYKYNFVKIFMKNYLFTPYIKDVVPEGLYIWAPELDLIAPFY